MQEGAGWFLDGLCAMFGVGGGVLGLGVFGSELLTGLGYQDIYDGLYIRCTGLYLVSNLILFLPFLSLLIMCLLPMVYNILYHTQLCIIFFYHNILNLFPSLSNKI